MIAVVKNGVIAEKGKHETLMNMKEGVYASIVALHTSASSQKAKLTWSPSENHVWITSLVSEKSIGDYSRTWRRANNKYITYLSKLSPNLMMSDFIYAMQSHIYILRRVDFSNKLLILGLVIIKDGCLIYT